MSVPDRERFSSVLHRQGLALTEERLTQALDTHTAMWPALDALRTVPLAFVGEVFEPATALNWIERGGEA